MIQGTGSGVGKSLIVTGLCRIFRDIGINVAPFKAQNMGLNSFITEEGGEIGRAQALQAEAAGISPSVDMNPILLKASGETGCQVIMNGRVHSNMKADEYYAFKKNAWEAVTQAYERLSKKHDLIVIEGAGSPAEINLMDDEIVNMKVARYAKAPVILVGDIDKGGIFASLYGTIELLKNSSSRHFGMNNLNPETSANDLRCDADYIKAFIINKFRGDISILNPGLKMISEKTGRPVIGVLPYIHDIGLPEEDGLALQRQTPYHTVQGLTDIRIVVVKLQYISNFTDFDPFLCEPDVEIVYSRNPAEIESADIVIIPGSKNTIMDLLFLRKIQLDESIKRACLKDVQVIGICGGFQMLGKKIHDPYSIESHHKEVEGLGLLNIETTLEKTKTTSQVEARIVSSSFPISHLPSSISLKGYEIHMGRTTGEIGLFKLNRLNTLNPETSGNGLNNVLDGSAKGNVWGTYIHGIFDNDSFRRSLLNHIRNKRGLNPINSRVRYTELKDRAINNLAEILKQNIDIDFIKRVVRL